MTQEFPLHLENLLVDLVKKMSDSNPTGCVVFDQLVELVTSARDDVSPELIPALVRCTLHRLELEGFVDRWGLDVYRPHPPYPSENQPGADAGETF